MSNLDEVNSLDRLMVRLELLDDSADLIDLIDRYANFLDGLVSPVFGPRSEDCGEMGEERDVVRHVFYAKRVSNWLEGSDGEDRVGLSASELPR